MYTAEGERHLHDRIVHHVAHDRITMNKLLPIPYIPQATSITCSLASLSMVLAYHHKKISESDINKLVKPMKGEKEYHLAVTRWC